MRKIIRLAIILVIPVVIVLTLVYLYNESKEKPMVYNTESPFITSIEKKSIAMGTIVPRKKVEIKPNVSGVVDKIYVKAGDNVKTGDLLAKIRIVPNMLNLNNAENRLKQAQINFDYAKSDFERYEKLTVKNIMPYTEFQKYDLTFKQAKEELESAENNLQLIKEGVSKSTSDNTNTLIRSTTSGKILNIPVKEGNMVIESNTFNEGTTIASIADLGDMIFQGKIDETEVGKVRKNMELNIKMGAIDDKLFKGKLIYISPEGQEYRGAMQFDIEADIYINHNDVVRAGYSANAEIIIAKRDSVLAINEGLIKFEEKTDSVYVEIEVSPQKFKKQYIRTGLSDGINTEIISGLNINDKIKAGSM